MKTGRILQEMAIELDRQLKAKRDYLVDTPATGWSMMTMSPSLWRQLNAAR